jgi:hypothetical protein
MEFLPCLRSVSAPLCGFVDESPVRSNEHQGRSYNVSGEAEMVQPSFASAVASNIQVGGKPCGSDDRFWRSLRSSLAFSIRSGILPPVTPKENIYVRFTDQ